MKISNPQNLWKMSNYDIKMPYYLQAKRYKTMLSNFLNIDITRSKNKGLKAVFLI